MPPRKEPKETVVYPASKRKVPPFKPQRPSKASRTDPSQPATARPRPTATLPASRKPSTSTAKNSDDELEDDQAAQNSSSDEDLAENPLAAKRAATTKSTYTLGPAQRKPQREPARIASLSDSDSDTPPPDLPPERSPAPNTTHTPSETDDHPGIPQPLLVRLLHEHFADKSTKIDKHAIQVLQKYIEVFVREAIARARMQKKEDTAGKAGGESFDNAVGGSDWLELSDLEKVAAGMMLDF